MGKLRLVFSVLIVGAIVGYLVYAICPGLVRDWRLRSVPTQEVAFELTDGQCRTYLATINFCDLKLRTEKATLDDTLLFVDFSLSDKSYQVVARAEAADLSNVTTQIALDNYWNRVISFAVFVGLLGLGVFGGIIALLKPTPAPAQAGTPQRA